MRSEIAARLKAIRKSYGRTQAHMAERLGVSTRAYAAWERGESDISTNSLDYYAGMGWSMNWIFTGFGPEMLEASQHKGSSPDQGESQDLSLDTLKLAVQTVEEARQIVSLSLSPEKAGEVVSLVYQLLCSGLAEAEIIPITRQALNVAKGEGVDAGGSTASSAGRKIAGGNR